MAYKVFDRTSKPLGNPVIAVLPDGRLALNAACARILRTAKAEALVLLWDSARLRIGFKISRKDDPNAFAISQGSGSVTMRAKTFFDHIGWAGKKRESLPATWNEKEWMFEVPIPPRLLENRREGSGVGE